MRATNKSSSISHSHPAPSDLLYTAQTKAAQQSGAYRKRAALSRTGRAFVARAVHNTDQYAHRTDIKTTHKRQTKANRDGTRAWRGPVTARRAWHAGPHEPDETPWRMDGAAIRGAPATIRNVGREPPREGAEKRTRPDPSIHMYSNAWMTDKASRRT